MSSFRLGIVGGMGPLAGIHLQKLIVEATPAGSDQEHLQVICFTNPQIPDRTKALLGEGPSYLEDVADSIRVLSRAGATHALIACHTAHAKISEIRQAADIPVIDLVQITLESVGLPDGSPVGLLATSGTIRAGVYSAYSGVEFNWILPEAAEEVRLMDLIYKIKSGAKFDSRTRLTEAIGSLKERGAQKIILGCTELSLCGEDLQMEEVIDPLRVAAKHVVNAALRARLDLSRVPA